MKPVKDMTDENNIHDLSWDYGVNFNFYESENWFSIEELYQAFKQRLLKEIREDKNED